MYALDDELADLRRGLFMDVVEDLHHSMQKKERKESHGYASMIMRSDWSGTA
jgi:hypothetical protein